jgi:hypothetical protein
MRIVVGVIRVALTTPGEAVVSPVIRHREPASGNTQERRIRHREPGIRHRELTGIRHTEPRTAAIITH